MPASLKAAQNDPNALLTTVCTILAQQLLKLLDTQVRRKVLLVDSSLHDLQAQRKHSATVHASSTTQTVITMQL
jgi:hypothetical protein